MNAKRLERFEKLLLEERARLVAALGVLSVHATVSAIDDDLPGDDGSAGFAGATDEDDSAVAAHAIAELREVDEALRLIHESPHDYGICVQCGRPIPDERLAVFPTTRYCGRRPNAIPR